VVGYSGFRIVEELLRSDPAHHILGLRLTFFVASLLCVIGLAWFVRTQRPRRRRFSRTGPAALGLGWLILALSGCGHGARAHAPATEPGSKGSDVMVVSRGTANAPTGAGTVDA
jgi:hypothetical protein